MLNARGHGSGDDSALNVPNGGVTDLQCSTPEGMGAATTAVIADMVAEYHECSTPEGMGAATTGVILIGADGPLA